MSKAVLLFIASITAASLSAQTAANPAKGLSVSCSVSVDYQVNNAPVEAYTKDFIVQPGAAFEDDFSTNLRAKFFNASVAKEGGNIVVSIDYFSDVSVFDSISFNTRLTMHGGRGIETTSGGNTFSSSQAAQPGNHTTNYTLTCKRT
jgi:NAD(P)-dependent dehydrogenase (short-subunit alcohol dehydrogenase family)